MTRAFESRLSRCVLIMTLALAACGSPATAPPQASGPTPAPIVTPPIQTVDVHLPHRHLPRHRSCDWQHAIRRSMTGSASLPKRCMRSIALNCSTVGPSICLRAVIVVEATVDREGRVTRSKILRSPGIASLDDVALTSLKAASPLPAPPCETCRSGIPGLFGNLVVPKGRQISITNPGAAAGVAEKHHRAWKGARIEPFCTANSDWNGSNVSTCAPAARWQLQSHWIGPFGSAKTHGVVSIESIPLTHRFGDTT